MSIVLVSFPLIIWVTEVVDELVLVVFLSTTNVIGAITDKKKSKYYITMQVYDYRTIPHFKFPQNFRLGLKINGNENFCQMIQTL